MTNPIANKNLWSSQNGAIDFLGKGIISGSKFLLIDFTGSLSTESFAETKISLNSFLKTSIALDGILIGLLSLILNL